MAKLTREIQKIFATDAQSTQVTAFRTAGDVPTYTKDVSLIQNTNFTNGWLDADNAGNVIPYAEDMNGLFYTLSRNIAYINQAGIPEWSNAETYYENAMCMYSGVLYISLQDNNTNRQPNTQTSYWTPYASPVSGSVTGGANLGTGEGLYASTSLGTMSFKSLVAGSNITLTPSVDGTSITIDSTGGGGSSSVAWGDITGTLSTQTDLATALSQRGTLSGTNTWTGSNTFSSIVLGSSDLATTLSGKQNTISVSSPLSLAGSAISISQASSTTDGYLSSADWTSFNSKLSSTIFSANNTWSGTNTFYDILPYGNNTNGDSSHRWSGVWGDTVYGQTFRYSSATASIIEFPTADGEGNDTIYNNGTPSNYAQHIFKIGDGTKLIIASTNVSTTVDIIPNGSGHSLGTLTSQWSNSYIDHTYTNLISGINDYYTVRLGLGEFNQITGNSFVVKAYDTTHNLILGSSSSTGGIQVINSAGSGYWTGTAWAPSSDEKLKKNIETNEEKAIDKINQLRVVDFNWKKERDKDNKHIGFIANEVEKVIPNSVFRVIFPDDSKSEQEETLVLDKTEFIPYLVKAVQELSAKVSVLENKLKEI